MSQTIESINQTRLNSRLIELSKIGRIGETGVQRFALSDNDREAQELVASWMKEAGMQVRHDNFGNMIGRKEGNNPNLPVVMMGSHIDTVPSGGRFDGTIGVLGGIEVVQTITENKIMHDHPIEVVAFCDEEGTRFSDGLFGSRGMIGKVKSEDLLLKDGDGITREEALRTFGFGINPSHIDESVRKPDDVKVFLEMHIEQGPFLEANDYPIGIVKAIAGPAWCKIQIKGEAGHAGTVPMDYRKDPMSAAAWIIQRIETICKEEEAGSIVGTVGKIEAFPGGRNVIPDSVEFSLDLRDVDINRRNKALRMIEEELDNICCKRDLEYVFDKTIEIDPVQCSDKVIGRLQDASKEFNLEVPIMISGAGHDAMFMRSITDIGLIFVRCKKGISHNPEEDAKIEDISKGTELILRVIKKYI